MILRQVQTVAAAAVPLSSAANFFDFFHQSVDDLRFRNFADDFALLEDQTDALAAGDAEIGRPRLARTVDFAAHHRHVDV